jgi:hypothetical protein
VLTPPLTLSWHACRHKPTGDRRHRLVLLYHSFVARRSLVDTLSRLVDGGEDQISPFLCRQMMRVMLLLNSRLIVGSLESRRLQ